MTNRQLFLKVDTAAQYVGQIVDERLRPVGIPGFLLALLTHVRDNAPVSPSTVSLASGVPATTLRDNIQRLVDRRLVRRIPNPEDRRSYLLVLTRRGEAVTDRLPIPPYSTHTSRSSSAYGFRSRSTS